MKQTLKASLAAGVLALGSLATQAAPVSFTGNLASDNNVQLFSFTLAADADVSLRTWSHGGGLNAAGNLIAAGGFDPIVSLFFGSGGLALLFDANDDGIGLGSGDALLERFALQSGTYTVALSQAANFAIGPLLEDGFLGAGNPGFGGRSSAWALDILGASSASPIPEPSTFALALISLAALAALAARAGNGMRLQRRR